MRLSGGAYVAGLSGHSQDEEIQRKNKRQRFRDRERATTDRERLRKSPRHRVERDRTGWRDRDHFSFYLCCYLSCRPRRDSEETKQSAEKTRGRLGPWGGRAQRMRGDRLRSHSHDHPLNVLRFVASLAHSQKSTCDGFPAAHIPRLADKSCWVTRRWMGGMGRAT